jgi:hypothetical protein
MPRSTPATMQIHAMTMVHTAPPSTAVSAARHRFEARREIEADVRIEDFDRRAQKIGQGGAQGFGRDAAARRRPHQPRRRGRRVRPATGCRLALGSRDSGPTGEQRRPGPHRVGGTGDGGADAGDGRATPPGRPNTPHAAARAAAARSPPNAMDAPPP